MEGEADVPDGAGGLFFRDPGEDAHLLQAFPLGNVGEHVHEVIVNIVRTQAGKFFPEGFLRAGETADHILGQLGGDIHLRPDAVALQNRSEEGLAAGIDIGRVIIIDARMKGGHDFLFRLFQIQSVSLFREAHAAETQNGQIPAVFILAVLHCVSSDRCFCGC